jgi:glutathione S-transferase
MGLIEKNPSLGVFAAWRLSSPSERVPAEQRSAKAGEVAKQDLEKMLALLDHEVSGRPYLVGDRFSLADLAVCGFVPYLRFVQYDIASHAGIKAWSERCLSRPAAQRAHQM